MYLKNIEEIKFGNSLQELIGVKIWWKMLNEAELKELNYSLELCKFGELGSNWKIGCCSLCALLPVGTVMKFPDVWDLLGRLKRADMRRLVKSDRFGDLLEFILGAGIGS